MAEAEEKGVSKSGAHRFSRMVLPFTIFQTLFGLGPCRTMSLHRKLYWHKVSFIGSVFTLAAFIFLAATFYNFVRDVVDYIGSEGSSLFDLLGTTFFMLTVYYVQGVLNVFVFVLLIPNFFRLYKRMEHLPVPGNRSMVKTQIFIGALFLLNYALVVTNYLYLRSEGIDLGTLPIGNLISSSVGFSALGLFLLCVNHALSAFRYAFGSLHGSRLASKSLEVHRQNFLELLGMVATMNEAFQWVILVNIMTAIVMCFFGLFYIINRPGDPKLWIELPEPIRAMIRRIITIQLLDYLRQQFIIFFGFIIPSIWINEYVRCF